MRHHALILVALLLAVAPRPGRADRLPDPAPAVPARPLFQGITSLFQSPPHSDRAPASPPAVTAVAPPAPARQLPSGPVATIAAGTVCRPALIAAEARYGIPSGLLQAIGLVESGRSNEQTGQREPWPWTINADGQPHFFDTKQEAVIWVRQALASGAKSIDIGCAQINLQYHPDAFRTLEEAFDPASNADYAAKFLTQLRNTVAGGNWMTAVGYYHSQTPELADTYRRQVQTAQAGGTGHDVTPSPLPAAPGPLSPFAAARPLPVPGGARPQQGVLLAAPSGTVGRGLDAYRAAPIQMAALLRPRAAAPDLPAVGSGPLFGNFRARP